MGPWHSSVRIPSLGVLFLRWSYCYLCFHICFCLWIMLTVVRHVGFGGVGSSGGRRGIARPLVGSHHRGEQRLGVLEYPHESPIHIKPRPLLWSLWPTLWSLAQHSTAGAQGPVLTPLLCVPLCGPLKCWPHALDTVARLRHPGSQRQLLLLHLTASAAPHPRLGAHSARTSGQCPLVWMNLKEGQL